MHINLHAIDFFVQISMKIYQKKQNFQILAQMSRIISTNRIKTSGNGNDRQNKMMMTEANNQILITSQKEMVKPLAKTKQKQL